MQFQSITSPHRPHPNDVQRVMREVLLALIPGFLGLLWFFGWGVLVNMLIACSTAVVAEYVMVWLRGRDPKSALRDLSAIVTAALLALALPPLLPWWQTVVGTVFAIALVKHLYGGLGYNLFNPAMAAYVLLLVSFPAQMTTWLAPSMLAETHLSLGDTINAIFFAQLPVDLTWDAVSSATPLDAMRTQLSQNAMISEIRSSPLWGDFGGRGWEWIGNFYLLGGLYLLWRKVITWHIPVAMILGLLVSAGIFWAIDGEAHPFPAFHLFSGGALLGAFFIATDPVTASTTKKGQLIYGAAIGVLVFIIRTWGGFPDAVAFAVLLMNTAAPTIDHYTKPKAFGHKDDGGKNA